MAFKYLLPVLLLNGLLLVQAGAVTEKNPIESLETEIRSRVDAVTDFTVELPRERKKSVRFAADYGLSVNNTPAENTLALQRAIDSCKADGVSELRLAPGTYRMGRFEDSRGDRITGSRTISHYTSRLFQIKMIGMKDFTLNGQGAELIFTELDEVPAGQRQQGAYLFIKDCERVLVTNLTLDWEWSKAPLASRGQVIAVNEAEGSVDYRMNGAFPHKPVVDIMREYNRELEVRDPDVFSFPMGAVEKHEWIADDVLRFTFKSHHKKVAKNASRGDWGIFKLRTRYAPIGISADNNRYLTLDGVRIYAAAENAIWARLNKYFQVLNCKIMPRPGEDRAGWSSNGGMEIHNMYGYFRLENSEITHVLDDVLHFSDFFVARNIERLSDRTLKVGVQMYYQTGDYFRDGSRLLFYSENYEPTGLAVEVESAKWLLNDSAPGRHSVIVTTKEALPEQIDPDSLLFSDDFGIGHFVVRNNRISNSGGHGLLINMPNGLVEGNVLENMSYPSIFVGSWVRWSLWPMGYPVQNVIVRNNTVRGSNTVLRPPADIFVGGGYVEGNALRSVSYPVASNVIVEGNIVENTPAQALTVRSAKNVILRNNRISNAQTRLKRGGANVWTITRFKRDEGGLRQQSGAVYISDAQDIFLVNNELSATEGDASAQLVIDTESTRDIVVENNRGF